MSNRLRKLTHKQEKFAQAIIDGHGQSEAYKLAYDTSSMMPATIHNSAYKLMQHGEIAARIAEAREAVATGLMAIRIWTAEKLVDEAEVNLQGAREDHAWAPANRALEVIARLTGNLEPQPGTTDVRITKVTVVLPSGKGSHDGELGASQGIVDAEGYTVLPRGDEGADTEKPTP